MYFSAPPTTSTAVSAVRRCENAASAPQCCCKKTIEKYGGKNEWISLPHAYEVSRMPNAYHADRRELGDGLGKWNELDD
jgi:hypothetical protein